jgi:excisionase family DNA binding protein
MSAEPGALLTVQEVAELLKVPVSWVYDHSRPGCSDPLPYVKVGKYLRFFAAEINAYLSGIRSAKQR